MISIVKKLFVLVFVLVYLACAFWKIIKPPKRKDKKYFVIICLVYYGSFVLLLYLHACGWVDKITNSTNKYTMETEVTDLSLLYILLILNLMLLGLVVLIAFDIYKKRKSLSLRTEFNILSLSYFLFMTVVCALYFVFMVSNVKKIGEAVIVWWFTLLLFVPNWLVYLLLCVYIIKIKLSQRIDLLIEKSIKSCLIGIAAWSVLFFNLKALIKISVVLNYFKYFCILGGIFPIFYPLLDIYEYTILEIKKALY